MVNFKSVSIMFTLFVLASCAPLDQEQLVIKAPQAVTTDQKPEVTVTDTVDAEISTPDNQSTFDNQTSLDFEIASDNETAIDDDLLQDDERRLDNQTASAAIDIVKTKDEGAQADNQTVAITAAPQIEAEIAPERKSETDDNMTRIVIEERTEEAVQIIPAPKPIEPLNPVIFTGLTTQSLEKRLGRPDRQFNEQALDVWHYEEPHCHALFFIHNRGNSAEIMHVDLRAAILQTALNQQACFGDFGQRAEALLDKDKR